jgi:hypothetical protein
MTYLDIEKLAEAQHRVFRTGNDLTPPWSGVHEKHRERIISALDWAYRDCWATSTKLQKLKSWIQMMIMSL